MTFDLVSWLRGQSGTYNLVAPLVQFQPAHRAAAPSQASASQAVAVTCNGDAFDQREWLVTNGLGSYASANIWGANARRYHGLLVAALAPPARRTVMLSRIDESARVEHSLDSFRLSTNYWKEGEVSPAGFQHIEAFTPLPVPTWMYDLRAGKLIKQVAMLNGVQAVAVGYTWLTPESKRGGGPNLELSLDLLLNYRDFHGETRGSEETRFQRHAIGNRVSVRASEESEPMLIGFDRGAYKDQPGWYWNYYWPMERARGLNDHEDNFHPGQIVATLAPGQSVTVIASLDNLEAMPSRSIDEIVRKTWERQALLLKQAGSPQYREEQLLTLAADNLIVERQSTGGSTIIAGYHWFGDWGRDSMISLPGLTLSSGRAPDGKSILTTFGRYLSDGMLPNNFPNSGAEPEYNTSDATFWWAWALFRYYQETRDIEFVREQLPLLESVVEWHKKGTRHGLRLDIEDGLIDGGDESVQLTWMDAKVGNYVVTPRTGKCVEINALWYNFLRTIEALHVAAGSPTGSPGERLEPRMVAANRKAEEIGKLAEAARDGFAKFTGSQSGSLYDVILRDGTKDASIRPNQLLAASLTFPVISREEAAKMLAVVERELLTPVGLRTLDRNHNQYQARYGLGKAAAGQYDRDITYHQGTVWPWLIGPWVNARIYAYGQTESNFSFIAEYLKQRGGIFDHILNEGCVGSVSEIFDAEPPYAPQGCIAQAWSVAELLRVIKDFPQIFSGARQRKAAENLSVSTT